MTALSIDVNSYFLIKDINPGLKCSIAGMAQVVDYARTNTAGPCELRTQPSQVISI